MSDFVLPLSVVGKVELRRVEREAKQVDDFLSQAVLKGSIDKQAMPASSRMLDELVKANNLDLLNPADRKLLINSLEVVKSKAPAVHISFAADPPQAALEKIITWLRREIHPVLLLQIGLQPTIAAGCILRTPNKVFDFSLQKYFSTNKDLLISKLQEKAEQASL